MKWYFASLVFLPPHLQGDSIVTKRGNYLLYAAGHDDAFGQAAIIGQRSQDSESTCQGVAELLLLPETPCDGAELLWSQEELETQSIDALIRRAEESRNFGEPSTSDWYLGSIILLEVHDQGSHGETSLIWTNSHLICAATSEIARDRMEEIGAEQQDNPGSHSCDGEEAHWEFKGVLDVIPLLNGPGDGSLLWSENVSISADALASLVPPKENLGVFRWEAGRLADGLT